MNRRTFAATLFSAPAFLMPGLSAVTPSASREFDSPSHAFASMTVEVQLAWTEQKARGLRNDKARDPFDGQRGEFYISGSSRVEIPDHLPGTITTYETIVGVAAQEGVIHLGAFRRGTFVWTVRVSGSSVDHAIEAGEAITAMDLPDATRVRMAPFLLNSLLPAPGDFSIPVAIKE